MERENLTAFSKEELMELIKNQNSEDLKTNTGCGTLFLIILVLNIISYAGKGIGSVWENCAVSAVIVLWNILEVWWKKRMNKCNDAELLVNLYKKYTKYRKAELIIALVLMVVLTYPLYLKYTSTTVPVWLSISLWGAWVALFCVGLWRLFKKPKKSPIDQDIELLQKLIGK